MIRTATWAAVLENAGYKFAACVPCSTLSPLQDYFQSGKRFTYVAAPNEGLAVGVVSGVVMGGQRAVVLMQNSGLGNAVNPLTSLVDTFRLPLVMIASWRGQPGRPDEPQHTRMGLATHALLDAINIRHITLDADHAEAIGQLNWAIEQAEQSRSCVAIVVPDGVFEPMQAPQDVPVASTAGTYEDLTCGKQELSRTTALRLLCALAGSDAIRVATTGKTGRELCALSDDSSNLYVVGSMGLASSVGLGLSLALPHRTLVIDGDGAALMHLGALPMIARYGGRALLHVVLDNGCYDSTGGQRSLATHAPFGEIAARCGYVYAACADDSKGVARAMAQSANGPSLIQVLVHPGSPPDLARPSLAPHEVLARLHAHLGVRP